MYVSILDRRKEKENTRFFFGIDEEPLLELIPITCETSKSIDGDTMCNALLSCFHVCLNVFFGCFEPKVNLKLSALDMLLIKCNKRRLERHKWMASVNLS